MKNKKLRVLVVALLMLTAFLMPSMNSQLLAVHATKSSSTTSAPPPIEWNQTYGGPGDDEARSVVQTIDGGYALAGYTNSSGAGGNVFWLVKTDSAGNMQWNQTYGGTGEDDKAYSVVQTSDGGYALAGYTNSSGLGDYDFMLVKTNPTGGQQWSRTYGGPGDDEARSVVQTIDGGYALAGYTNSSGQGEYDFWLVKTDPAGNKQWDKSYGGAYEDKAYSVVQTIDGGYALAGYTSLEYAPSRYIWEFCLVKTNPTGGMQWNQTYGRGAEDKAYSVIQTIDGGYALAGYTATSPFGSDFWLVKTNPTGGMQWNQTYEGASKWCFAYSLCKTSDGGYALAGYTYSSGQGNYDFWLVKTDSAGNMQWNQTYGGTGDDEAYSVVQTNDGGYALTGYTNSSGAGGYDFYLVKARSCTLIINAETGGTTDPPPDIYFYGVGTVVTVKASPYANYLFDHWLLDGGYNTTNPINVPMNTNHSLQAFFTPIYYLTVNTFTLPGNATAGGTTDPTPGTYTYNYSGAVQIVSASPYANYLFDHWLLDGGYNTTNPINVPMNTNHSLQAFFTPSYTLTVNTFTLPGNATAGGTTDPTPGTYTYPSGQVLNVTALPAFPNIGYYLDHWELNGSNVGAPNPISITMNASYMLKAVFHPYMYTLTITATLGGTTSPSGTRIYAYGTVVNITASPSTGYYFDHWDLDGVNVGGVNPVSITMNKDYALHAVFESGPSPSYYNLTITATAGGTTSPTPGTYIYSNMTVMNVTASPDTSYYLNHWELDGSDAGAVNPMNVTMDTDHALHAVFLPYHDVAVINVTSLKTIVCQGFNCCGINVTVANQGGYIETFNVTAYANDTATGNTTSIVTFMNVTLAIGTSRNLTFDWNTTGFAKGNYTISAYAEPIQGETHTADNMLTDGIVKVTMVGDVNGDGKVNLIDVFSVALAYGSYPGHPKWNPNLDINNDHKIDLVDYLTAALNYGKTDP